MFTVLRADIWAIGCIFAEMILSNAIFPGEEVKEKEKGEKMCFQLDQLKKIMQGSCVFNTWDGGVCSVRGKVLCAVRVSDGLC